MYADVVFPLKLPPLTYRIPTGALSEYNGNLNGRIVKAPLRGRSTYGLVTSIMDKPEIGGGKNIKEIQGIHRHFASESTISFLKWLSDYYLSPMGVALKPYFFEEAISVSVHQKSGGEVKAEGTPAIQKPDVERNIEEGRTLAPDIDLPSITQSLTAVCQGIKDKDYRSFLLQVPSIPLEHLFLNEVFNEAGSGIHGAIILVPEIGQIERLLSPLQGIFGERLCILHSRLTKREKIEAIQRVISGRSDVILGTRSAVLAPLKNISFIAVLSEHSPSYKGEEGLRYHGRDIAVMRGFIEGAGVLLSSICPSIESVYNSKIGKYTFLDARSWVVSHGTYQPKKKIKIINMRKSALKRRVISEEVFKEAKRLHLKKETLLFLVGRKGYSLIRCEDCNHILKCSGCHLPLVFYKSRDMLRCHYCGHEERVPESCIECKGFNTKPSGAGTERMKEELEGLLKTGPIIVEKGKGLLTEPRDRDSNLLSDFTPFVIGTSYVTRKLRDKMFDSAAILNIDALLSRPDFRAYERTFQEVMQVSQSVRTDGSTFLQTWHPENIVLRFIKSYDFDGFYKYELSQRDSLGYPPLSRIISFNILTNRETSKIMLDTQNIADGVRAHNNKNSGHHRHMGIDLLGPIEIPSPAKSYRHCIQILMKSRAKKAVHLAAKILLSRLGKLKGVRINTDVDPLKI
ncbi:primosomal protein N' [Thermodesulfovibrionales bacterium]|nr:primosomal protein N' [Thermodesulfovibrionales bacterium]